jgi:DNA-binding NtrC family response regulator
MVARDPGWAASRPENELPRRDQLPVLIVESPARKRVVAMMDRTVGAAVLITGEHGTGKEVAAHGLPLPEGSSLVIVNAGGLPEG